NVETVIAKTILSNDIKPKSTIVVDVADGEFTVKVQS
ncbi:MAG: hypothetical protein OSJ68_01640, partial [Clostridia bacterium]|nr:hypothetical protein [Clostridia bacterium]